MIQKYQKSIDTDFNNTRLNLKFSKTSFETGQISNHIVNNLYVFYFLALIIN